MQIAKHDSMIISEHKRTSFDKDGSINKVDILRSIRKKQTEPSFLPSHCQQQAKDKYEKDGKFKEIVEYFLIAVIILCTVMLTLNLLGVSLSVNIIQKIPEKTNSNQSTFSLNYTNFAKLSPSSSQLHNSSLQLFAKRIYDSFIGQLKLLSQQNEIINNKNESNQIKLNEFKKSIFQNKEHLWQQFLKKISQNMSCQIRNNKMICEKSLEP